MPTWQFEKENKIIASGRWLAAAGIVIQVLSGAAGYPKIPPGIIILAGLLVIVGVFVTPGTDFRRSHPANLEPFTGMLVQLAGLTMVLVADIRGGIRGKKNSISSME